MISLEDSVGGVISSFVTAQTFYWTGRGLTYGYCERSFIQLNAARPDIFVYRFRDGGVELLAKPDIDWERPHGPHVRAPWYLNLFRMAIVSSGKSFDGLLALSLEDIVDDHVDVPMFAFQKPFGSKLILLPDIDTLSFDFYEQGSGDDLGYDEKSSSGIFIGATTGMAHTEASVAALESQRLRSGLFFRDRSEVDFRLPVICQCLTSEAEAAIRELGFGQDPGGWPEQLKHKFLLTMDGNGATCSRVVIALKSNSVPVKYVSPHRLYYFDALIPWQHYLPAYSDEDVLDIIHAERKRPGLFANVARSGQEFYRSFLTREPTLAYTAGLLDAYFSCFTDTGGATKIAPGSDPDRTAISAVAHLSDLGDVPFSGTEWIGEPGSGRALEGFQIEPLDAAALSYRVVDDAALESDWTDSGGFVGERGISKRLTGFAFRSAGAERCVYYGRFLDGREAGPRSDGDFCISPEGAPLEAIRLILLKEEDPTIS